MSASDRFESKSFRADSVIQFFFGSNALVAIVVLGLITFSLFREGAGFFPANLHSLQVYRLAGLEYVDIMRSQIEAHTALNRSLQDLRLRQLQALTAQNSNADAVNASLADFDAFAGSFDDSVADLRGMVSDLTDVATAIKAKETDLDNKRTQQAFLLKEHKTEEAQAINLAEINFANEVKPIRDTLPAYKQTCTAFAEKVNKLMDEAKPLSAPSLQPRFEDFKKATRAYLATFPQTERKLQKWNQFRRIPWYRAITSVVLGKEWITACFWQDFYGVIPLLAGSLIVSLIALTFAVPLGVCAAIYVSELAQPVEAQFIKPFIEFISAIPSVVLAFFGIAFLGDKVVQLTQWHLLSWVPGFPISGGLNAFTAGCLLALMAIPTIFTLSEDAINSVPRAFKEASYALGATRLQTIFRILVPASISGIISAVLLGFGRVVGETMVVLLCAGNRIAIPDFTQGVSALFQPVHTMTGIVAQEMGEVPQGSIHYRALFVLGLLLFFLSLLINWFAQAAVRRYKISVG